MTARVLVEFDLVTVAALLPPVPVVVLADVVEGLLKGVRAHAEVGVGQHHACGVYIAVKLQLHAKALTHVLHHVVYGAGVAGFEGLGTSGETAK